MKGGGGGGTSRPPFAPTLKRQTHLSCSALRWPQLPCCPASWSQNYRNGARRLTRDRTASGRLDRSEGEWSARSSFRGFEQGSARGGVARGVGLNETYFHRKKYFRLEHTGRRACARRFIEPNITSARSWVAGRGSATADATGARQVCRDPRCGAGRGSVRGGLQGPVRGEGRRGARAEEGQGSEKGKGRRRARVGEGQGPNRGKGRRGSRVGEGQGPERGKGRRRARAGEGPQSGLPPFLAVFVCGFLLLLAVLVFSFAWLLGVWFS